MVLRESVRRNEPPPGTPGDPIPSGGEPPPGTPHVYARGTRMFRFDPPPGGPDPEPPIGDPPGPTGRR